MKEVIDKSRKLFDKGFGCAEAVMISMAEAHGIQSDLIPRIATGFCGGMAKTDGMCGAVSGGVMALSMIHGRDTADGDRDTVNEKVQHFIADFFEKYATTGCTALTGCDLRTKEGHDKFNALNMHARCSEFVGEATKLVLKHS